MLMGRLIVPPDSKDFPPSLKTVKLNSLAIVSRPATPASDADISFYSKRE